MKTVLITGSNRGIGLELVKQYYHSGWRVIACCRNPESAIELNTISNKKDDRLTILKLDVSNEDQIRKLGVAFQNESIDILINNAGIIGPSHSHLEDIETNEWLKTFKINTIAPTLLSIHLAQSIANSQLKMIVNISSTMGSIELYPDYDLNIYAYRSSKSALNAVTKCLSHDLKPKGITVIALSPGWVKTDMGGSHADLTPEQSVEKIKTLLDSITLKDSGKFIHYNGQELPW